MKYPTCSLIITTYNWPEALGLCLQSITWQTILPNEIIIADDGSKNETKLLIEKLRDKISIPIKWLWHEDIGKRKTRINNKAIACSKYEYLIFIDHDIILHPFFIEDHLNLAEPDCFLNGSRFLIDEQTTQRLLNKKNITPAVLKNLSGKNTLNTIRSLFLMKLLAHNYQTKGENNYKVRGCNMSFWKKDLYAINGYDEKYSGWGREDSNIAARLYFNNVKKKSLKFGGIIYHMHHNEADKSNDDLFVQLLRNTITTKETWIDNGLKQHL